MNRQEIFDKAVAGLRSQGFEKSMDHGTCSYRADDGKKCAIGWLIKDENYDSTIEGRGANSSEVIEMTRLDPVDEKDELFLAELQQMHDYSKSPENMRERLHMFAGWYNLNRKEIYA